MQSYRLITVLVNSCRTSNHFEVHFKFSFCMAHHRNLLGLFRKLLDKLKETYLILTLNALMASKNVGKSVSMV